MAPVTSPESFFDHLKKSNLLTTDQLAAINSSEPGPKEIAKDLIRQELLTKWQANQLLGGNHSFFLGKYKLLSELGRGGMGIVYKARHQRMNRIVALKVISDRVARDSEAARRFRREVEAAARLRHPHVVAAYDANEDCFWSSNTSPGVTYPR